MIFFDRLFPNKVAKIFLFFIVLFTILFSVHFQIVKTDPLLNYDDFSVVAPMNQVSTLHDYAILVKQNKILDRQPIRDFSFWVDYQIQKLTSFSIHHLTSLLIWSGIAVLLFYIFLLENISHAHAAIFVTLYTFHPSLTIAVSWVSARKHLLSTLFILGSTYLFIKYFKSSKKNLQFLITPSYTSIFLIAFFYLLSCLSQPINIAWPFWALLYCLYNQWPVQNKVLKNKIIFLFILLLLILIATALVNFHYYNDLYAERTSGISKFMSSDDNQISYKFLAIGASFFQTILPIWPTPSSYYPGSFKTIIGLMLFVIFLLIIFRNKDKPKRHELFLWLFFAALPLIVINAKMTNILGSDTYLLIPAVGIYMIFVRLFPINFYTKITSLAFIVFFIFNSNLVSHSFSSSKELWLMAQDNEESPIVIKNLAHAYLEEKDYKKSFELAVRVMDWNPSLPGFDIIYSSSLYNLPDMPDEQKIIWLDKALKIRPTSPYIKYYLSNIYFRQMNWNKADFYMRDISPEEYSLFGQHLSSVAADFFHRCQKASTIPLGQCSSLLEKIKSTNNATWNQELYSKHTKEILNI